MINGVIALEITNFVGKHLILILAFREEKNLQTAKSSNNGYRRESRNVEQINKNKNDNSLGVSKIKSENSSLFCSRAILDLTSNKIKVNIVPSTLVNARFDTVLKDSTMNLTSDYSVVEDYK